MPSFGKQTLTASYSSNHDWFDYTLRRRDPYHQSDEDT